MNEDFFGKVFENVDLNYTIKTSNIVYVNEKVFNNNDSLYVVKKVLRNAIQLKLFSKTLTETTG